MIFKNHVLLGIKSGKIKLAFRKWRKPAVKTGGTQKDAIGVIRFGKVLKVSQRSITQADATAAGYSHLDELLAALQKIEEGSIYKIQLAYESEDPRIELREQTSLSDEEFKKLRKRLDRLDAGKNGPWTSKYLRLIDKYPERRAGDLADMMNMEKEDFKLNVRKLKNLGLTVSHEIGYSVSPLGHWMLENWKKN
jgi:hypothetical protein